MDTTNQDDLANLFEERAENLAKEDLLRWTADMPDYAEILRKLEGPGAKLLSGPRGSGKSTLLKKAYFTLLDSGSALPVYVNYARSLALEPLFHRRADALQLFQQWVVAKIVRAVFDAMREVPLPIPEDLVPRERWASELIKRLEVGRAPDMIDDPLAPSDLLLLLEKWCLDARRHRCVLLLDDAAHAFSSEEQRQFFEIFRTLKSRVVSAKAAVYPGVTSYSPTFHLGHEAELVVVWCKPDDPQYLRVMRRVFDHRFKNAISQAFENRQHLIDYLAFASFGIPRGFLGMISQVTGVDESSPTKPTKAAADKAILEHAKSLRGIFRTLAQRLPRFRNFVEVGVDLDRALVQMVRDYNYNRNLQGKAVVVGIAEPIVSELSRILAFLEYAGMLRSLGPFSRGNRGIYHRYSIHYALLMTENGLNLGKAASVENVIAALVSRDAHAVAHTRADALLGANFQARCSLDLAPCPRCHTPRTTEDARFCVRCGAQLVEVSIYDELLGASIRELPLTQKKIEGLLRHSTIRTVKDVILDEESTQIRSVPRIGPVWARRIHTAAEEFTSV